MTNNTGKIINTTAAQQDKCQPQYLSVNQQNGMTRIYGATIINPKNSTIRFEQLLAQITPQN